MNVLYKVLVCEILKNLDYDDVVNFALTNKKYVMILKDEYFWKCKRKYDYPGYSFDNYHILTERQKYCQLKSSGFVWIWEKNDDLPSSPKPFLINNKLCLAQQAIPYSDSFAVRLDMYILDYNGNLYNNYNNSPVLVDKNIKKIYEGSGSELYIQTHDNRVYSHKTSKTIGWNVKKFCYKNFTTIHLTHDNELYLNHSLSCRYFRDVDNFAAFGDLIYYIINNIVYVYNFLSMGSAPHVILKDKNIKNMKCIVNFLIYLTNDNILYAYNYKTNHNLYIDSSVHKFWTDNFNCIYYLKNNILYLSKNFQSKSIPAIQNLIDIQFINFGQMKIFLCNGQPQFISL